MTVTDAHVWLGRLQPDGFLGGSGALDREAIRPALTRLADDLGADLNDAAEGILLVADSAMERALRVISVERGYDPADFALVAFGGAGGLHAAGLAQRLGLRRAIVPPLPGLLSAYGMLAADITREMSRTVLITADPRSSASPASEAGSSETRAAQQRIEAAFRDLERQTLDAISRDGVDPADVQVRRSVDARYAGQSFELRVPAEGWINTFHRLHEERYGYRREDSPVEAVTLRVAASAPGPELKLERLSPAADTLTPDRTRVHVEGHTVEIGRVWREMLGPGHELPGPLVVMEYSATTWVPEGWWLQVDEWGNLHLSMQ